MGGLESFHSDRGYDWAEYAIATGAKLHKPMGKQNNQISLSISLKRYLGDNILEIIENLSNMMNTPQGYDLIFISGVYQGKYFIQSISDEIKSTLPNGEILEYQCRINLMQYIDRELITTYTQSLTPLETIAIGNELKPNIVSQTQQINYVNAEMINPNIAADKKNIGDRLGDAIKSANQTAQEVEDKMGAAEQEIKNYLTGRYSVPVDRALKLMDSLGIDTDWLYTATGNMMSSISINTELIKEYRAMYNQNFVL